MEVCSSNIKKFLTFSLEKAVLIFQETETQKIFFIFSQKKAFLIFRETETPKKFPIFQETETPKTLFIFREMELSRPKLKKLLIFQEELPRLQKPKFIILLQTVSILFIN